MNATALPSFPLDKSCLFFERLADKHIFVSEVSGFCALTSSIFFTLTEYKIKPLEYLLIILTGYKKKSTSDLIFIFFLDRRTETSGNEA